MAGCGAVRAGAAMYDKWLEKAQQKVVNARRSSSEPRTLSPNEERTLGKRALHINEKMGFKIGAGVECGASFILALIGILGMGSVIKMPGMQAQAFLAAGLGNAVLGIADLATLSKSSCWKKKTQGDVDSGERPVVMTGEDEAELAGSAESNDKRVLQRGRAVPVAVPVSRPIDLDAERSPENDAFDGERKQQYQGDQPPYQQSSMNEQSQAPLYKVNQSATVVREQQSPRGSSEPVRPLKERILKKLTCGGSKNNGTSSASSVQHRAPPSFDRSDVVSEDL